MFRTVLMIGLVSTLTACASTSSYQLANPGGYGYSEQALESDRFRVSFKGNSSTERADVENMMLYRAAELTLDKGYDHFMIVARDTETSKRLVSTGPYSYSPYGIQHRYYHPLHGWHNWNSPLWNRTDQREVTKYEAQAEILFGRGKAPAEANAYEAREVLGHLAHVTADEI